MKSTAPAKYHDILIPDFDVGCKRRIFDGGYLESLHNDKLHLMESKLLMDLYPRTSLYLQLDSRPTHSCHIHRFAAAMALYRTTGNDMAAQKHITVP